MSKVVSLILLLLTVATVLFFNVTKETNITAFIAGGPDILGDEERFAESVEVIWAGRVIAVMSGGACIGVEGKFDNYSKFMACLPDEYSDRLWNYSGDVTITGKWLGITCAYKNTIFGECVPDVEIKDIN